VSQSPGPPLKDPPTSPPHLWMGAPWGDDGGSHGARAAPNLFGRPAKRRRPVELSSGGCRGRRDTKRSDWRGVRAAAITSGVRASNVRTSSGPASGMVGDRGDDLAGGRDHSAAAGAARAPVRPAGSFPRSGKESRPRSPGAGNGRYAPVLPVNTGRTPPSPALARSALITEKKAMGPEAPGLK